MSNTAFRRRLKAKVRRATSKLGSSGAEWYEHDLPWRIEVTPYRTFLAEFLLVRTRADLVANVFESIVDRFPTPETIVSADIEELRRFLAPLGLTKRAAILKRAASHLVDHHEGGIPEDARVLMEVPGLGAYTSRSISHVLGGEFEALPADVNILRFLSRFTALPMDHPTKGSQKLQRLLESLPKDLDGLAFDIFLDFTRNVCRPRNPWCEACPVSRSCTYYAATSLD